MISSDPLKNEKQFSQTRSDVVKRCIKHATCLVDAVAAAEADGLIDRDRLFPKDGAVTTPSHAQVKYEATEFVRLRDARDERLMAVIEEQLGDVEWPSMFDELAAWRRARGSVRAQAEAVEAKEGAGEKEGGLPPAEGEGTKEEP